MAGGLTETVAQWRTTLCVPTTSPRSIVPPSASTASSTCLTRRPRTAAPAIPPTTSSAPVRTPTASALRSPASRKASFRSSKENTLTIKGEKTANENGNDNSKVLYRGIAARAFERVFQLADFVQVKNASLENGLLHVDLVREIPEAKKPRSIPINSGAQAPQVVDASVAA